MKLILAVLRDEDNEAVGDALVRQSFRVTRIATTGGFFRRGSTTLMIGIEDDKVEEAIDVIRKNVGPVTSPETRRATLFVVNVASYQQV